MTNIQLNTSCIFNLPLQTYGDPFTFVINGKEFQTNRLISDLLSPKISLLHQNDPTIDTFIINTRSTGDFSTFLQMTNFKPKPIREEDLDFIIEVIEQLGNENISIKEERHTEEITKENVITNLIKHAQFPLFYSSKVREEIEFISAHFFEIVCKGTEEYEQFKQLDIDILYRIVDNEHLRLRDEDQLLEVVNELYSSKHEYSILYETVEFKNVSEDNMKDFIQIYDHNDMNASTWRQLCSRLEKDIKNAMNEGDPGSRYRQESDEGKVFQYTEKDNFNGIINYLRNQTSGEIENEIKVTGSSCNGSSYDLTNAVNYDNKKSAGTLNQQDSWIRIDFKNHRIIPTDYTIRSTDYAYQNWYHPKSWVIEILNDNEEWEIIDTQNDVSYLNGKYLSHTFKIKNPCKKGIHSIRIRQTSKNHCNYDHLIFDSIEIFGTLI